MIRNTRFVYYEIENDENENEKYYGLIDIKLNQIIFNTNKTLKTFKPLNSNSMLAIIEKNAYQICAIKEGDKCVNNCFSGKLFLDPINGNHCISKEE